MLSAACGGPVAPRPTASERSPQAVASSAPDSLPSPDASVAPVTPRSAEASSGADITPPQLEPELVGSACVDNAPNLVFGLSPATLTDWVGMRRGSAEHGSLIAEAGRRCLGATDMQRCERDVANAIARGSRDGDGFNMQCAPSSCVHDLIVTRAGQVEVIATLPKILELLGPIDAAHEAMLVAFASGYYFRSCDAEKTTVKTKVGFQLVASRTTSLCPIIVEDDLLQVTERGVVSRLKVLAIDRSHACALLDAPLRSPLASAFGN